jgi:Na+(H+)/acetate symporter ActP
VYWAGGGSHIVAENTTLIFPAGAAVPVVDGAVARNAAWLRPEDAGVDDMVTTYSLMFATFLGTMGLPHVLVRFYTNPDGRAARRTALHVLLLLGVFYLFPTIFGALSRLYIPQLLVTGRTDAAVLLLPSAMLNNPLGSVLSAVTAAGAFAAFLATSAGLVVCVAGVLATDVLAGRVRDFRLATAFVVVVPLVLALGANTLDVSQAVVLAFAMAASTFCPLLVLGIWWRGLTAPGAAAGLLVGGGLALASTLTTVFSVHRAWMSPLLLQPAVVSVPAAFVTMVVVSKATRRHVPPDVSRILLRLHAPDPLGFVQDRAVQRFGSAEEKRDSLEHSHGRHRK